MIMPLEMKRMLSNIYKENIKERYLFEETLGEGAFGKVKVASLLENRNKKFAIKSIPRCVIDEIGKQRYQESIAKYNESDDHADNQFDE